MKFNEIKLDEIKPEEYARNDIGSAALFHKINRSRLRYVIERKSFFYYDGKVWKRDTDDLMAHKYAKEFVLSVMHYFYEVLNRNDDEICKYYSKYLSFDKRNKLIKDAKSIEPLSMDILDKSPYMFNCQNGTVDLISGKMHEHTPDDFLSKISNVIFDPNVSGTIWDQFIDDVMQGDEELKTFLQDCAGYSISGATFFECFFITYGKTTRNGKGTFNSTLQHMLGDYAATAAAESFESRRYKGGGANEDIARLVGSRYVSVSEPDEGMTLNSALIKTLSGNDRITARYLYENSFEFTASFKIWFNTNHLPAISDDTVFKSGRVILIPFNRHFDESERNAGLKSELIKPENISAVFNWCMRGFQKVAETGKLVMPESVRTGIAEYRTENDRIGEFLNACYVSDLDNRNREKISTAFKVYMNWCRESNYKPLGKRKFREKVAEKYKVDEYAKQDCIIGVCPVSDIPKEWRN